MKAAALGRGPPYQKEDNRPGFPASVWDGPRRRIDQRIRELDDEEGRLVLANSEQAHYALGLLSVEQDLDKLDLEEGGK